MVRHAGCPFGAFPQQHSKRAAHADAITECHERGIGPAYGNLFGQHVIAVGVGRDRDPADNSVYDQTE
jgi:hypothetical protein